MSCNIHALVGTRAATDRLTTDELMALYVAATAGTNPKEVMGYEKAKGLFTEFHGTKMHPETLAALDIIVNERLEK